MEKIDAILTYHTNILTCGIARFNYSLSKYCRLRILQLFEQEVKKYSYPLISLKTSEFTRSDLTKLDDFCDKNKNKYSIFLHGYDHTILEKKILKNSRKIFVGNSLMKRELASDDFEATSLWCPNSNDEQIKFEKKDITLFSFGMAHKIKTDYYKKLKEILEKSNFSYSIYLSTALHENTNFEDSFFEAFEELKKIFPKKIYFLGFLSDSAVYNYMINSDYFLAFFNDGIRENNTSAYAAFEANTTLITNLDQNSPQDFIHEQNLIDINKIKTLNYSKAQQETISKNAKLMLEEKYSWEKLVNKIL